MSIKLQPAEATLSTEIVELIDKARKAIAENSMGEDVRNLIQDAGERSHKLHMLLKARAIEPKHHASMITHRDLQPDDTEFYMHIHPIEDLLKFLDNEHANDDPVDLTIGSKFTFRVYSNRWGHDDDYKVKRTNGGWEIGHIAISGPCDKGGKPSLFENLRHDSINYPEGLEGWMEWLWNQAEANGLTAEQVQAALQELADWVSQTEKSAPSGGVWEGY
jgi:hypothetical protein